MSTRWVEYNAEFRGRLASRYTETDRSINKHRPMTSSESRAQPAIDTPPTEPLGISVSIPHFNQEFLLSWTQYEHRRIADLVRSAVQQATLADQGAQITRYSHLIMRPHFSLFVPGRDRQDNESLVRDVLSPGDLVMVLTEAEGRAYLSMGETDAGPNAASVDSVRRVVAEVFGADRPAIGAYPPETLGRRAQGLSLLDSMLPPLLRSQAVSGQTGTSESQREAFSQMMLGGSFSNFLAGLQTHSGMGGTGGTEMEPVMRMIHRLGTTPVVGQDTSRHTSTGVTTSVFSGVHTTAQVADDGSSTDGEEGDLDEEYVPPHARQTAALSAFGNFLSSAGGTGFGTGSSFQSLQGREMTAMNALLATLTATNTRLRPVGGETTVHASDVKKVITREIFDRVCPIVSAEEIAAQIVGPLLCATVSSAEAEAPEDDTAGGAQDSGLGSCSICLSLLFNRTRDIRQLRRMPTCKHQFHETCLAEWLTQHDLRCPMCREPAVTDKSEYGYLGFGLGGEFTPATRVVVEEPESDSPE